MADEVFKTPEERLTELSDSILASVIQSDDLSKENRQYLYGQFSPNVFTNENYIIYSVFYLQFFQWLLCFRIRCSLRRYH